MTAEQFAELARQEYNRVPVTREVLADLETPLCIIRSGAQLYWLIPDYVWARYGFEYELCLRRCHWQGVD
jgi:hypothetical protein